MVGLTLPHSGLRCIDESFRDDDALEIFADLFREIFEVHSSPYIHIGGDETHLLGSCPRCKAKVRQSGKSALYVNYARKAAELIISLGRRPIIWADMLLKYPKEAARMPSETVFIDWRYGDIAASESVPKQFGQFEIWGSPAIRCHPDDHSFTDWRNHFANLQSFGPFARKFNHRGLIVTSWSTSGRYDLKWGSNNQILQMQPSRRVYPLPGFQMLQRGFIAAATQSDPFSTREFVPNYFENRFGISSKKSARLYEGLIANSSDIGPGTPLPEVRAALKVARKVKVAFDQASPKKNKPEWQHLVLQVSLRALDMQVREIEALSQESECTTTTLRSLGARVKSLFTEARALNRTYRRLNKKVLLPVEIEADVAYRNERLENLNRRLNKVGCRV